jgi:potassium efflux system protein
MAVLRALWSVLCLALLAGAVLVAPPGGGGAARAQSAEEAAFDADAWARLAERAEAATADPATATEELRALRAEIADWRALLLEAQTANRSRIETLRGQLDALGPPPAEGATEAPEIATRRAELEAQTQRLEAPAIAAEEGWRRADGLIGEIDGRLRDRQAAALMTLGPSPLNPLNWQSAWGALASGISAPLAEIRSDLTRPAGRAEALANLPVAFGFAVLAALLVLRGRRWMGRLRAGIEARAAPRWRGILMAPASLAQVIVPILGVVAGTIAVRATALGDAATLEVLAALPIAGAALFTAVWLAERLFSPPGGDDPVLRPGHEARARGHLLVVLIGWILAADIMLDTLIGPAERVQGTQSPAVLGYPLIVLGGIVLWRLGRLLRLAAATDADARADRGAAGPVQPDATPLRDRLVGIFGLGARGAGAIAPLLGGLGYLEAAGMLLVSSFLSLGLAGLMLVIQRLLDRLAIALAAPAGAAGRGGAAGPESTGPDTKGAAPGLLPVVTGIVLIIGSLPIFALIWGAQPTDLAEIWARLAAGIIVGDTRVSPTALIWFAVVFGAVYSATRLVQAGLRGSVLPRTTLDQGGQTAIVAGVGYVGIFLAAVAGISAAGFDLSSLAIVAGALSVGIGFGLQNIVSNFVAGIILLIERPVSEGDWIEVGGAQGIVRAISVRSTRIETFERTDIIVPNADLISNQVTNWTRFNLTGRLIVKVGVAHGTDTRRVAEILTEIAQAMPGLLAQPAPMAVFAGFGPSSLDFELRVFLHDVNASVTTRSEINHAIAERFAREGIEIPFPQREARLRTPSTFQPIEAST